jgi:hypothetical protein
MVEEAMNTPLFTFQPGEFVEVEESTGGNQRVGQINSIQTNSISVTWWEEDSSVEGIDKFFYQNFYVLLQRAM